ncbi:hypothetical protein [Novosphingobium sp. NDB2Meth1]|uniref:hypothetical protein n=1 Tax=Novosphingobium sp. NDB2Meth1 TaxID=1892847 RepID=UPI0009300E37|nr:hypothetical protein [Novosphingobium sp. NDB2Meth1]
MDDVQSLTIYDPASLLVGLGAVAGLLAAWCWWRVSASVDTAGERVRGPSPVWIGHAALSSALAMGLMSSGYLLGRFVGKF